MDRWMDGWMYMKYIYKDIDFSSEKVQQLYFLNVTILKIFNGFKNIFLFIKTNVFVTNLLKWHYKWPPRHSAQLHPAL
jgi:hypothetical protein